MHEVVWVAATIVAWVVILCVFVGLPVYLVWCSVNWLFPGSSPEAKLYGEYMAKRPKDLIQVATEVATSVASKLFGLNFTASSITVESTDKFQSFNYWVLVEARVEEIETKFAVYIDNVKEEIHLLPVNL